MLEVGTGTGSLTAMMAQLAAAVITVEIDAQLFELASEQLIDVTRDDAAARRAAKQEPHRRTRHGRRRRATGPGAWPAAQLVANLPYNIATPLIANLLLSRHVPHSMTVTIQKELADRIIAPPSTKDYSALSVWIQSQCTTEIVRMMPPSVFWPAPKVSSAIFEIGRRSRAAVPE